MKRKWARVILLAMAILWVCFIFNRSMQTGVVSGRESKAVLSWLNLILPGVIGEYLIRKLAHFTEFCILGFLLYFLSEPAAKRRVYQIAYACLTGMFFAVCDETIQLCIDGRGSSVTDVWIDTSGAVAGVVSALILNLIFIMVRKWFCRKKDFGEQ